MLCPRCNATNPDNGQFCFHCGLPFYAAPAASIPKPDRTLKFMLFFAGWIVLNFVIWTIISFIIDPLLHHSFGETKDYWDLSTGINNVYGWIASIVSIPVSVITVIKLKNTLGRVIVSAYLLVAIIDLIAYQIMPLFEKKNDFIYYQF